MWAEVAQTEVLVIIARGPTGWRLSAEVGRHSTITTGNANPPAEVARILRNVMPELFVDLPTDRQRPAATGATPPSDHRATTECGPDAPRGA